jgi:hypothetical protein
LKAEKTLLGSILAEKLKNTLSCRNKGTYNVKFEPLVGKTCYEIRIYEKLLTSIIHISYNPKHKIFVFLSFEPGTDVQPVIEEKIMPMIEENKDFFM